MCFALPNLSQTRENTREKIFIYLCSVKQGMMRSEKTSFPIEELMLEAIIYGRPRIRGIRSDILSAIFRLGSGMSGRAACCEV